MITEITSIENVELFMKQLVEEGTNAHPDDDFNNYISMETGKESYTPDEAEIRNQLMEQCFDVCV